VTLADTELYAVHARSTKLNIIKETRKEKEHVRIILMRRFEILIE